MFKHNEYPDLDCPNHAVFKQDVKPNCIVIFKESDKKQGSFEKYLLADFYDQNQTTQDALNASHDDRPIEKKKIPRRTQDMVEKLASIENSDLSAQSRFFSLICSKEWENTTFVTQDSNGTTYVSIN